MCGHVNVCSYVYVCVCAHAHMSIHVEARGYCPLFSLVILCLIFFFSNGGKCVLRIHSYLECSSVHEALDLIPTISNQKSMFGDRKIVQWLRLYTTPFRGSKFSSRPLTQRLTATCCCRNSYHQ